MSRFAIRAALALAVSAAVGAQAGTLEVRLRDALGQPVAEAAVYAVASGGPAEARPRSVEARGRSAEVAQVDREFVPFVTVVQVGTAVAFPNRDPILHHVYSFSPAKPFEIKLYTGTPLEVVFDKPGVVALGCNIHDWMLAYIVVVPTPYFGRSDANGAVTLSDLPPGSYELHAFHPLQRAQAVAQSVVVGAPATPAEFQVDLQPRKAKFKPPLDRLKY